MIYAYDLRKAEEDELLGIRFRNEDLFYIDVPVEVMMQEGIEDILSTFDISYINDVRYDMETDDGDMQFPEFFKKENGMVDIKDPAVYAETMEDFSWLMNENNVCIEVSEQSRLIATHLKCSVVVKYLGIPVRDNKVMLSTNMSSSYGLCCCKRKNTPPFVIKIADKLLKFGTQKSLECTIYHELLHTCEDCFNHGKVWKMYATYVSRFDFEGLPITRLVNAEEEIEYNLDTVRYYGYYAVQCIDCGKIWVYKSECDTIKNPQRYKCSCGGKLERVV